MCKPGDAVARSRDPGDLQLTFVVQVLLRDRTACVRESAARMRVPGDSWFGCVYLVTRMLFTAYDSCMCFVCFLAKLYGTSQLYSLWFIVLKEVVSNPRVCSLCVLRTY